MATKKRKSKRGNRTFTDPNGDIWDSPFEWHVYNGLRDLGYSVRRCDKRDSLTYNTPVTQGKCLECGNNEVVVQRVYTPDLHVVEPDTGSSKGKRRSFIVECKGYFPQQRRTMLKYLKEQYPDVDLRFIFSSENKLTPKRTNVEYAVSLIKCPAAAWNDGAFEWRFPK